MTGERMDARKIRLVAAWLVAAWLAQLFLRMGAGKFDPAAGWTAAFRDWGYPAWMRQAVGVVEVVCGPLLIVPWTASWAAVPLALVMVGALGTIVAHRLGVASFALDAGYLAGLLWVAIEFRAWRYPRSWIPAPRERTSPWISLSKPRT